MSALDENEVKHLFSQVARMLPGGATTAQTPGMSPWLEKRLLEWFTSGKNMRCVHVDPMGHAPMLMNLWDSHMVSADCACLAGEDYSAPADEANRCDRCRKWSDDGVYEQMIAVHPGPLIISYGLCAECRELELARARSIATFGGGR